MIKAIIFDWDGVIVDSMQSIAKGIQEAATLLGANISVEETLDTYFQPRYAFYESLGIDVSDKAKIDRIHLASVAKHSTPAPLFPEVAEVLRELNHRGKKLALASTVEVVDLEKQLKQFGLENLFEKELVEGGMKPKEQKLTDLLLKLGYLASEVLYVGDLPSDVIAARTAGTKAAGIQRREGARERLIKEKPDFLLGSLEDLLALS
jgi:HAD superfamily hydrolase (TIGR01509 family)